LFWVVGAVTENCKPTGLDSVTDLEGKSRRLVEFTGEFAALVGVIGRDDIIEEEESRTELAATRLPDRFSFVIEQLTV